MAIVGKGVCFDSGGLDIKTATRHAADEEGHGRRRACAGARGWSPRRGLPVRLHLLIPAVENAVSGSAYRPGDIVKSRKGLFVEIDNTDAEGRLVLADALARAAEDKPELIIDFATLTGAARVALGPDLPALFANREDLAARASKRPPRRSRTRCGGCRCGTVTTTCSKATSPTSPTPAARRWPGASPPPCSCKRFVPTGSRGRISTRSRGAPQAKPGRPKGGDALGLRAAFAMLWKRVPSRLIRRKLAKSRVFPVFLSLGCNISAPCRFNSASTRRDGDNQP